MRDLHLEAIVKGNGPDKKPKKKVWPTGRHQPGYYFCSKPGPKKSPLNPDGVSQMSLAGLPDCDPTEGDRYSMIHALYQHRKRLASKRTGAELIAELKTEYPVGGTKKKLGLYPGAGALMSTRVLTYLEGASLFDGVVKPYLGTRDGPGNKVPAKLVAGQLGITEKEFDHEKVMASVQRQLNVRCEQTGKLPLQEAIESAARGLPSLAPIAEQCGELGSTLITGGSIETMLCRCTRASNRD